MSDRYEKGIQIMREHLGSHADEYVENIREVAPVFAQVNVEFAFGDIYGESDKHLDKKTQELITVGALTVLGYAKAELRLHIDCALRCGATKDEIVATITQMLNYCGFPAATDAIKIAKEVFQQQGLLD